MKNWFGAGAFSLFCLFQPLESAQATEQAHEPRRHVAFSVAFQRNDEIRHLSAEGCMLGAGERMAQQARGLFDENFPPTTDEFCITALSASLERGELTALTTKYALTKEDPRNAGIAFATGFHDGFIKPERYAAYRAAPQAMVTRLRTTCLLLQGKRKDCLIAGALQGIAERRFLEANPDIRQNEFEFINNR